MTSVSVLLAATGSVPLADTVATAQREEPAGVPGATCPENCSVTIVPAASSPTVQVGGMVIGARAIVPPDAPAKASVSSAGRAVVSTTSRASDGPVFVTVIV
jgi:hypothetical protein